MSFYDIRLLYIRELRSATREKGIWINVVLVPLLLYPALLWTIFTAVSLIRGQEEQRISRMELVDLPASHSALLELLEDPRIRVIRTGGGSSIAADLDDPAIRNGELDLRATFRSVPARGLPANIEVDLVWNSARDRSAEARQRFEEALEEHRGRWLEKAALDAGVTRSEWSRFRIHRQNQATGEQLGAFVLGLVAPVLMIVMVSVGCFYPAVDAIAGERERSTWETTLTLAASRESIVGAKFLYVATLGTAAGLINLFAMAMTMQAVLQPMMGDRVDLRVELPWAAIPLLLIATFLLALFLAAGMMLFAAFARTFKEGQSMVGPFYLLALLPAVLVTAPDLELTLGWALVPVANVSLLLRQAILGIWDWPLIALVLLVEVVTVTLCLTSARWILAFEDVWMGEHRGGVLAFLRSKLATLGKSNLATSRVSENGAEVPIGAPERPKGIGDEHDG